MATILPVRAWRCRLIEYSIRQRRLLTSDLLTTAPNWVEAVGRLSNLLMKLEAPPGFEPGVEVLQTSALPLGDGALHEGMCGANYLTDWSFSGHALCGRAL
jgi:hypothetical protein